MTARVRVAGDRPVQDGDYVLYWMIQARRAHSSYALDRALERCSELGKPLLVLEAIRAGHRYNTARVHRFVLDGMADNARSFAAAGVTYLAYVEPTPGHGRGLLACLAERACVVVTDDPVGYFLPRMVAAAARSLPARLEAVDGDGLIARSATDRPHATAASFRRVVHRTFLDDPEFPVARPLDGYDLGRARVPDAAARWRFSTEADLLAPETLAALPLDHEVAPVAGLTGGTEAGRARAASFLAARVDAYVDGSRHPDTEGQSRLSPYLHFGHVSAHEVVRDLLAREGWNPLRANEGRRGRQAGFWGVSDGAESFLDEIVTWRELPRVFLHHGGVLDRYDGLPDWARRSLAEHDDDPREAIYGLEDLEAGRTGDPLWNACQAQLREEGVVQSYLRMLWGKRVLSWTRTPEQAFAALLRLNDRWAIDGRDPNGWAGIAWCFGRFDRAWGPERPIYGKIRYMTSDASRRKLRMKRWLARFEPPTAA